MGLSTRSLLVCFVLMMSVINLAEAQSGNVSSCVNDIIPCADYLNATNPPASCCDPLKQTVATKLKCLCDIFYSPGFLDSLNINVTQALDLSRRCGVKNGLSSCKGSAPSPSSSSIPPPATPGGDNGAGRVGFTGLSFLLLFWASMLFN